MDPVPDSESHAVEYVRTEFASPPQSQQFHLLCVSHSTVVVEADVGLSKGRLNDSFQRPHKRGRSL